MIRLCPSCLSVSVKFVVSFPFCLTISSLFLFFILCYYFLFPSVIHCSDLLLPLFIQCLLSFISSVPVELLFVTLSPYFLSLSPFNYPSFPSYLCFSLYTAPSLLLPNSFTYIFPLSFLLFSLFILLPFFSLIPYFLSALPFSSPVFFLSFVLPLPTPNYYFFLLLLSSFLLVLLSFFPSFFLLLSSFLLLLPSFLPPTYPFIPSTSSFLLLLPPFYFFLSSFLLS